MLKKVYWNAAGFQCALLTFQCTFFRHMQAFGCNSAVCVRVGALHIYQFYVYKPSQPTKSKPTLVPLPRYLYRLPTLHPLAQLSLARLRSSLPSTPTISAHLAQISALQHRLLVHASEIPSQICI